MSFQPVFAEFWQKVIASIEDRTFAKLTLAKTIGDTELKNIYARPIIAADGGLQFSIIARYKSEEIESFHSIEETFIVLSPYINNPFLSAILFTTQYDLTFKLNKKRAGSLIESDPTFKNASDVMLGLKASEDK